jgi:hypothetical protein
LDMHPSRRPRPRPTSFAANTAGIAKKSRVQRWRSGLGTALRAAGSFVWRCPSIPPCSVATPRSPNQDVRICPIRLLDKGSCRRTRRVGTAGRELLEPKGAAQVGFLVA